MTGMIRVGDVCEGHENGYPPRAVIEGSPNVTINGLAAARAGDACAQHCNGDGGGCHAGKLDVVTCSERVFINGKRAAIEGVTVTRTDAEIAAEVSPCASVFTQGSPSVTSGAAGGSSPPPEPTLDPGTPPD